jgi:hypothetical protein
MTWRQHIARQPSHQPGAASKLTVAGSATLKQRAGNAGMQRLFGSQKFNGVLGTNRNKELVTVKREIGDGYGDRWQATAVARLAKAEPAAVALTRDGKWRAFETTAAFSPGKVGDDAPAAESVAKNGGLIVEVFGVPSLSAIGSAEGVAPRAAAILGVPEADVRSIRSLAGRETNSINIVGSPERGSPGGGNAPIGGETGFEEGKPAAFWIDLPELDRERAAETLFHEDQHLRDWNLAQSWIAAYRSETGRLFVKSAIKPFADWLNDQAKKNRLSKAERELVLMTIADATAYTEANANVRSFLADLEAGAPKLAKQALVGYARALKPQREGGLGQYANPAPGSEVVAGLIKELRSAYDKMPRDVRLQYDAAVAAAKIEYPGAWIAVLDFARR